MVNLEASFGKLGEDIINGKIDLTNSISVACARNPWFTRDTIENALSEIATEYLSIPKIKDWLSQYDIQKSKSPKDVGIVMASNVPLVGFHDLFCVLMAGHRAKIKMSERDNVLLPILVERISSSYPGIAELVDFQERLSGYDAVIATGSDHSMRYFRKYFSDVPNILRGHRNAVAILNGEEGIDDLTALGSDIFLYYGLGCRNVSKILVPRDFSFGELIRALDKPNWIIDHHKYRNNYDYNLATAIISRKKYMSNENLILLEDVAVASKIAVLHYEYYESIDQLHDKINRDRKWIQCIVTKNKLDDLPSVDFGKAQSPGLADYADDVDVMDFLTSI